MYKRQRRQRVDVGTRHARVQDVTDDRHRQVGEILLVVADGVHVEQPLRGVRVAAIAGVDHVHMRRNVFGNQVRRARTCMPHDEHIGLHGRQVVDRVQQRFALARGRRVDVQVDHVRRQPLGRNLERGARARGVLEEQIEDALACLLYTSDAADDLYTV